jgi:hypothetical protein
MPTGQRREAAMSDAAMSDAAGVTNDPSTCVRCGGQLTSMGVEQFRVGGTSGGWKMVFGELAELGEGILELEALACSQCRRVELRVPGGGSTV